MLKIGQGIFLLLSPLCFLGQSIKPLHFERIPGLSQNTAYSIIKDKQGFLWIATADGLNRYDGVEMKTYKPELGNKPGQMKGRIIRSGMLEDDYENIWFSTDVTVNCFNKRKASFTQYKVGRSKPEKQGSEGMPDTEIFAHPLLVTGSNLWVANPSQGLTVLNTALNKSKSYPLTIKDEAGNFVPLMYNGVFDGVNKFWFASKQGLLCFDTLSRKWTQQLNSTPSFTLTLSGDSLFIGSESSVLWFDTRSLHSGVMKLNNRPAYIKDGLIRRLYTDDKGNNWAGDSEGNVYRKKPDAATFNWEGNINGVSSSMTNYPVYCFYADAEENVWVGADVLGLSKASTTAPVFNKYPFSYTTANPNKTLFVYSIYEEENGKVWLGTFQNGLVVLDKRTGETETVKLQYKGPALLYGNSVPLIKKDSLGNLWTSSFGFLYIKEKNAESFQPVKIPVASNALQSPQLWSLSEYKNGWLLGTNLGLYMVTKKNGNYDFRSISSLNQSKITGTWVSTDGNVWVIPESGGIIVMKNMEDGSPQKRLFPEVNVKSVQYDKAHQIAWIGTNSGLIAYHLPTGRHKIYGEEDGLLNGYIYGIQLNNNEIWISTNFGLCRTSTEYNNSSVFPNTAFTSFTRADGLPGNEFTTGTFYKADSGTLYFGTTNGVVWFNPSAIRPNLNNLKLRLTNFLVNDEQADSTTAPEYITRLELPYYKNNLFFRFRGIDFNNGKNVQYMYQLEGWDKKWIHSKTLNEVRYNRLAPGTYIFKIRAASGSGWRAQDEYTITVRITPPFWKSWWFYSLCILVTLLGIILITRFFSQQKLRRKITELEKQKEIDRERQRISREMHDDIGAGLTQITLMSESAKMKTNPRELDDIAQTSRQLVNSMSEIIWSLNPENKTAELLMNYLREQLNRLLEYSDIQYSIQLPEGGSTLLLSNEQRRNILLVTKEIVNNAIKYSKADHLSVLAVLNENRLVFTVQDNGVGFDADAISSGNGLKNIRHRVEELKGTLTVATAPGMGSKFVYTIPLLPTT